MLVSRLSMFRYIFLAIAVCSNGVYLPDALADINEAVQAYDANDFGKAATLFEEGLAQGVVNGHVYYNLGNAYYRSGQKGAALAAYLAARRLLPRDPDLKSNIRYVQRFTVDKVSAEKREPLWQSALFWTEYLTIKEQAYAAALTISLGFCLLAIAFFWRSQASMLRLLGGGFLVIGITLSLAAWAVFSTAPTWGAVVASAVDVHAGPSDKGNAVVFHLNEGAPFMMTEQSGDWIKIELSDGKQGWVRRLEVKVFAG